VDCNSSSSSSRSVSPEREDPVLDVVIPGDSAKEPEVLASHFKHLSAATIASEALAATLSPPPSLVRCVDRIVALGPASLMELRGERLRELKAQSARLQEASRLELSSAPPHVQGVLASAGPFGAHPALLRHYLQKIDYADVGVVDDLLRGFPLVGELPVDPSAVPRRVRIASINKESLRKLGASQVANLVAKQLRKVGEDSAEVFALTVADALLNRMTSPKRYRPGFLKFATRRFAVRQRDAKGKFRLRCIDDFHESWVNDSCSVRRRLRMGRHSDLEWILRELSARLRLPLRLLKSDFKAAFRGCPILTEHLEFSHILLLDPSGDVFTSQQYAMPFGAVGAVYAWDRVGAAISAILRDWFLVPVVRYVDDLFWAEVDESAESCREQVLEVVSLLGFTLEPSKTPLPSKSLDILGVTVSLDFSQGGIVISSVPDSAKVAFWLSDIRECLQSGNLPLCLALQLVGRLSFAAWAVWGQVARTKLRCLYSFLLSGAGPLPLLIRESLIWWELRLQELLPRVVRTRLLNFPVILVYTDAEGSGGLGAVFAGIEPFEWFEAQTPLAFTVSLLPRKTQIFALETVTVLLAAKVWMRRLSGSRVIFFVDNTSALGCLRKGSSSSVDVHAVVTLFWDLAAENHVEAHFRWVPSKLNLSDRPSRGKAPIVGSKVPFRCRWDSIISSVTSAVSASASQK
jgi:hypothetical protein